LRLKIDPVGGLLPPVSDLVKGVEKPLERLAVLA